MSKVPTRQVVRLTEVPQMIQARLDFSSCRNTLVGFTDKDGAYIVKSYREPMAYLDTDGTLYIEDDTDTRLPYVREGFRRLRTREAQTA